MRHDGSRDAADALDDNIGQYLAPRHFAACRKHKRHRRIEMRAGNGAENGDDHNEDCAGRDGVSEQRDRLITARRRSAMIPEPTTVATSMSRAEALGQKPSRQWGRCFVHQAAEADLAPASFVLPIASSCFCNVN